MKRIAHIVPTVPPEFNGLGDYCYQLCKHWPEPKPEWHILTTRIPEGAQEAWPGAKFHTFECRRAGLSRTLLEVGADQVILHYVPHAYHPKGIPTWLPGALADWKRTDNRPLVVVFHELFATAPLWRLTGWLTPVAKSILRRIVALADRWTTSTQVYFDQLVTVGQADAEKGRLVPVGPNIEFQATCAVQPKKGRFVVFGSAGTRSLAVKLHEPLLQTAHASGRLTSLLLVGSKPSEDQRRQLIEQLTGLGLAEQIEEHINLSAKQVSVCLASSEYALLATDLALRGKSGVYAACKAHRLRCVFPGETDLDTLEADSDVSETWNGIINQIQRHFSEVSR